MRSDRLQKIIRIKQKREATDAKKKMSFSNLRRSAYKRDQIHHRLTMKKITRKQWAIAESFMKPVVHNNQLNMLKKTI